MAEIIKLGSLHFDGQPQEAGSKYNNGQITFGPAIPGKEIQWIKANGLLIADRCVCIDISWEQLDDQGLVFGTPIEIDGKFYLCRCLKVGAENDAPNEWDAVLDVTNESDELWHWRNKFFWGQEIVGASYRAFRGYYSARNWDSNTASYRIVNVGFRPALEPLDTEPCPPDSLIGKEVRIYGPGWAALEGCLLDADDYDLILRPTSIVPEGCSWVCWDGSQLTVDRASVSWLKGA